MAIYIVKAKAAKVRVGSATGHRVAHIIRAGGVVPEGVDQSELDRLVERGLIEGIETVTEQEAAPEVVVIPEGDPAEGWTVKQLKAYAEREGKDLGEAKVKADILTVLGVEPAPAS